MRSPTWYERDERRLSLELEAVESAFPNVRLRREEHHLAWEGYVHVRGSPAHVRLDYPANYPEQPPMVKETEAFAPTETIDNRKSFHQFIGGTLCLYTKGYGERSWRRELTAADVLYRFIEFVEAKLDGRHVQEFYTEPESHPGIKTNLRVILSPHLAQITTIPGARGTFEGSYDGARHLLRIDRITETDHSLQGEVENAGWAFIQFSGKVRGVWANVGSHTGTWRDIIPSREAAVEMSSNHLPLSRGSEFKEPTIFSRASHESDQDGWVLLWSPQDSSSSQVLASAAVEVLDVEGALSSRAAPLVPRLDTLGDWRVVLVGLGSLGSTVALALARSGVKRFLLFDPDILRPENMWRHEADLAALFLPKVSAVKALIERRQPRAEVEAVPYSPLWDSSAQGLFASQHLQASLASPRTLVIITAAEDAVERPLNALLVGAKVPGIYASVLGRAEHGRIFRVLPGQTPCYECILLAQHGQPARFPRLEAAETLAPGPDAYRQPGIPGLGIDIEQIALMTARLALQTISLLEPGALDYPPSPGDHLLWSHHGGWVAQGPLSARWERYPRAPGCAVCGETAPNKALNREEREAMAALERRVSAVERLAPSPGALLAT